MKKRIMALVMVFAIIAGTFGAASQSAQAAGVEYADTSEYESLAQLYGDYFKVGCACEAISHWNNKNKEIGNSFKEDLILSSFNSITCGNEMKPAYNFSGSSETLYKPNRAAVEMLDWAKANGMKMRGHTLLWHSQNSPAIYAKDFTPTSGGRVTNDGEAPLDPECLVDRETLIERMKTYIYGVMEFIYSNGYADVIYAWDVLNEATDDSQPDGLRRSHWYNMIGAEYIYYAFLFAREATVKYAKEYAADYGLSADGDLSPILPKLFYNDYNEWFSGRRDNIISFLTKRKYNDKHKLSDSDVIKPDGDGTIYGDGLIDGIGMQGHINDNQNIDTYVTALQMYSDAVDEVHITELDVECTKNNDNRWLSQAQFFYNFFSRLIEERKNGVKLTAVTLWGLTDDSSWKSQTTPLLFYNDLTKKPAFDAMVLAAKGEEFNMTLASTLQEVKDTFIDFEPYVGGDGNMTIINPKNVGFFSRGSGHTASVLLQMNASHTVKDEGVCYGLKVSRKEKDATLKFDVSKYLGKTIDFKFYVKTEDNVVFTGIDGDEPICLAAVPVGDDWTEVSFRRTVPEDVSVEYFYIETDGKADFFVDDIYVTIAQEGDTAPDTTPVSAEEQAALIPASTTENVPAEGDGATETTEKAVENNTDTTVVEKTEEAETPVATETEEKTETAATEAQTEESGSNAWIIILIIAVVCLAAVAVAMIIIRKKKKTA